MAERTALGLVAGSTQNGDEYLGKHVPCGE